MISISSKGSWSKTEAYLNRIRRGNLFAALNKYGSAGVAALASATPTDTGLTAESWTYEIVQRTGYYSIRWHNTHVNEGRPIAILLIYGHGTRNGGYVQGRDFVMPSIRPIFDKMATDAWREVTK